MKTQYLFGLILSVLTLAFTTAGAQTTYNWTGSINKLWSVAGNWSPSGHPGASDNVQITAAASNPTVDVTAQCATLDFSGTGQITLTLAANLSVSGTLTIQTTAKLALAAGSGFTLTVGGLTTLFGNNNFTINTGNTAIFNSILIYAGSASATPAGTTLANKGGTTQVTGTITMDPAPVAPNNSQINNNGGTFYAGIPGTPCTINMSDNAILNNAGSGSFYLGPTSVINLTGANAIVNNKVGTITLQSDATGSATIGNMTGSNASLAGIFNVQRYITGGAGYRGYRLLSSPVNAGVKLGNNVYSINYLLTSCYVTGTTGITGGFDNTAAGNPSLYIYRENLAPSNAAFTSGNFRGINDITGDPNYTLDVDGPGFYIPVGNGFLFFFRGDRSMDTFGNETKLNYQPTNTTLTAIGKLNQGPITVAMWFSHTSTNLGWSTTAGNSTIRGFNLVGNPFPSSIDWDTYSATAPAAGIYAPGTSGFMYVLDGNTKNYNVYQAGFHGTGTIANSSNIIPSGQGFFVRAGINTAGLTFNESCKTNTQATTAIGNLFLGKPPVASIKQYLHLSLMADTAILDGALINFSKTATGMYDQNADAEYRPGTGAGNLSTLSADSIKLAFNTLPLPGKAPEAIKLNVNAAADGLYQLNLDKIESIPALYDISLMDAYMKDSLDIRHNPSYKFNVLTGDTNSYHANRFKLVVRQNKARMVHLLNFSAVKNTGWSQIVWQTENEENYTNFTVERSTDAGSSYTILGSSTSQAQGTYSFADKTPATGANLYRLKIADLNGDVTYSAVITIIYGGQAIAGSNISIYPNPAGDMLNLAVKPVNTVGANGLMLSAKENEAAAYEIKIFSITGAVIRAVNTSSSTWQSNVSTLTPGTYTLQVVKSSDKTLVGKSTFVKL